ncbi:hypothetical protein AB4Z40_14205 [Bosea sp. 2YAB26]|uniref:hypothetical protein n=1 Tax=Bosea sp. BIWAKO-01 TaxID=506668 RepID=UPI0008535A69|nr:hypothetical protein [Bosea sp. BIWAKO-01]
MPRPPDEDDDWRMTVNLLAIIATLLLLGAGIWLLFGLDRARKAQDCLSSTQRNCRQIRVP